MSIFKYFLKAKTNSADIARERLQIIVAHQRRRHAPDKDFLAKLQQELVDVIAKYVNIDKNQVKVELDKAGNRSVLELNITLPEEI